MQVLLVDRQESAQFITAVYRFDAVQVVPVTCHMEPALLLVTAGGLRLAMRGGRS